MMNSLNEIVVTFLLILLIVSIAAYYLYKIRKEDFEKSSMDIKFKKLKPGAVAPYRGSDYAAGYDLFACGNGEGEKIVIPHHETVKIGTGIAMSIPEGYFGAVFARSGLATKKGLRPANCVGVIDSDYRGEIIVALHNDTDYAEHIEDGERIAQICILPVAQVSYTEVDNLDATDRGEGGFGSTGTN